MQDTRATHRRSSQTRHRRLRCRLLPAGACLLLSVTMLPGCGGGGGGNQAGNGGNPVGPTVVNVGGSWKGTWTYTTNGLRGNEAITGTFNQSGANATGQLTAESGVSLNFTLDLSSGTPKGNATLYSYGYGQSCSASGAVSGEAAEARLVLRVPSASGAACTWQGTENEVVLTR